MTNEEAIKWLGYSKQGEVGKAVEALDMAIKALEQTTWIPVSERLPEENKTVIASTDYFAIFPEARYTKDGWEWAYEAGADYWMELKSVTAWMPLPEPYKESEI